jgi:hypothetical protein
LNRVHLQWREKNFNDKVETAYICGHHTCIEA